MLDRVMRLLAAALATAGVMMATSWAVGTAAAPTPKPATAAPFALAGDPGQVGFTRPCDPVRVTLVDAQGQPVPQWLRQAVNDSLAAVRAASGVPFIFDGVASAPGPRTRTGRDASAPLLIKVTRDASAFSGIEGTVLGVAAPDTGQDSQGAWIGPWDSAVVTLNAALLTRDALATDGTLPVVTHEVAHLVGLDHAGAGLMNPAIGPDDVLDAGTAAGLARLGCRIP